MCLILTWVCMTCGLEQDITFDDPGTSPPKGPSVMVAWAGNEVEGFPDPLLDAHAI